MSQAVRDAVIEASTVFRDDQIQAFKAAIAQETNGEAKWVLEKILENAALARQKTYPLCNDTGTPHIYISMGNRVKVPQGFFEAISDGVRRGLRELPCRPMAVKGGMVERLIQAKGLSDDPGELAPAQFALERCQDERVDVTVMMLGGGSEIRARTHHIFHMGDAKRVIDELTQWAIEGVSLLGCTPSVPAIGIGRTHYEATTFMLRALAYGRLDRQNELESLITKRINETGVGPLGLGGKTTALASFLEIGPLRASGVRIACMRLGCCYDPRRATVTFHSGHLAS